MISAKEKVMGRRSLRLKRIKRAADEKKSSQIEAAGNLYFSMA